MRHCSICGREVNEEESPILAMGGFGNPKYLCAECSADIDKAIGDTDPDEIELAMAKISDKLGVSGTDDPLVAQTIKDIFSRAGERAKKIKEGTYDFSEDEEDSEQICDIPEDLRETEEDKAHDALEAKRAKLFDKVFNWLALLIFAVAIVLMIIYFLTK